MTEQQTAKPDPRGVIVIVTNPHGDVIASVADFDRSSYGGFKLWEAQRHRAKDAAIRQTVRAYCSDAITNCLDGYLLQQVGDALRNKGGHKITIRGVGYPDDVKAEIER